MLYSTCIQSCFIFFFQPAQTHGHKYKWFKIKIMQPPKLSTETDNNVTVTVKVKYFTALQLSLSRFTVNLLGLLYSSQSSEK